MTTPANDKLKFDVTGRKLPTAEMLRAGVREFYSFDERFEDAEDVVARIWAVMNKSKPRFFHGMVPAFVLRLMHRCAKKAEQDFDGPKKSPSR